MSGPLIIVGQNTGAAARSAKRAGFDPYCVDLYARRDLRDIAHTARCEAANYPAGILTAIESLRPPDRARVLITGGLENHIDLVEALAFDRDLLGSAPQAVASSRRPEAFAELPKHKGLKFCKVKAKASLKTRAGRALRIFLGGKGYLIKPRNSFRGVGVESWSAVGAVPKSAYLQQFIRGTPIGIVFSGDGWSCNLVGVTEMIVGDPTFGGRDFLHVGNIGPIQLSDKLRQALMHLGVVLTQRFDLRGVFGVDAIMDYGGNVWPIECNPRYTDSIEVIEVAKRIALLSGTAVSTDPQTKKSKRRAAGGSFAAKASVRAKADVIVPDLFEVIEKDCITEVPEIGRGIRREGLVCTVHANARTQGECLQLLEERAKQVYGAVTEA